MNDDPSDPSLARRLLGYILVACGSLIAALSGACTLGVAALFVQGATRSTATALTAFRALPGELMVVLTFGGAPFAIGLALIAGGRSLLRRAGPRVY